MKKLIFLDIDGVLNHHLYYMEKKQYLRKAEVGYPMCDIDESKVALVNRIVAETGSKVVISSSWRILYSLFELKHIFGTMGFVGDIIGVTPIGDSNVFVPRGAEILTFMRENGYTLEDTNYIILDDDSDVLLWQQENYFKVDGYCGLTPNIAYRAINKLNRKY